MVRTFRSLFTGLLLLLMAIGTVCAQSPHPTATVVITGSQAGGSSAGTLTIAFNGHNHTVPYGPYSTPASIASAFAAEFASYPASAWPRLCTIGVCAKSNGAAVVFQLTAGAFGPISVTSTPTSGTNPFTVNTSTWPSASTIAWPPPSPIIYGTPLSALQLDATAYTGTGETVAGTFSYSPAAGTVLSAGSQSLQATFTPSNPSAFQQATASVTLVVNQATPTISISDVPSSARIGGSFTATYSYSGNGAPTESLSSSTTGVCTVSGNLVSFVATGLCTLQASAGATTNYTAATGSAQRVRVSAIALPGPGIINTFASNGIAGYTGDVGGPSAIAVDSQGNVYVVDRYDLLDSLYCRILEVNASTGEISTVAGSGPAGYSGDGGPATSAQINPGAIAVDGAGNIYLNAYNHIRMVNALTGVISTIAGSGPLSGSGGGNYGPTGDGGTYSGDGGPAIIAGLNGPGAMALDGANNLYFVDFYNDRIRKITSGGVISTVAGNGTEGYSGDGGPATSAELNTPTAVAVDGAGNIYIADEFNHRIRVVNTLGVISTFAGNGATGYPGEGDGGTATSAELDSPSGVAADSAGNIYIADAFGQQIRMVAASTGAISTVAGNGTQGYSGDGGPATSAELNSPGYIAVDGSGNIYIADTGNNVIRVVGPVLPATTSLVSCAPSAITYGTSTTCTATIAGSSPTGTVTFTYNANPWTSCTLAGGSCSVSGLGNLAGGFYTITGSYSGDGNNAAATASTSLTIYEATNGDGPSTPTISISNIPASAKNGGSFTVSYSYSGAAAPIESVSSSTTGVCTVSGNLVSFVGLGRCTLQASAAATTGYTAATGSAQSFTVSSTQIDLPFPGYIDTIAGNGTVGYSGDGGSATNGGLYYPSNVAVDTAGNVYIADEFNNRVRMVSAATGIISTVAGNGIGGNSLDYAGDGGPAINAVFGDIEGVAVDTAGNLYIADSINNRIRKVTASTGVVSTVAGNGTGGYSGDSGLATNAELLEPTGVAVDSADNLYIADYGNERVRKVTASTGVISTVAGSGGAGTGSYPGDGGLAISAHLWPYGVAVDSAANIYIADLTDYRIRKVSASTGIISTVAGNGTEGYLGDGGAATSAELDLPNGVAVDSAGNVYFADTANQRIRMVTASTGVVSTFAGNGTAGYSGDGGPAINAQLSGPRGLAVDRSGNVYIADAGNNVIRLVAAGTVPVAAGVSISCTPIAFTYGGSTTCTAVVTGSTPTGTITFSYNGSPWKVCTVASGFCSVSGLSNLEGGFYTIAGTYSGDGNNAMAGGFASLTISPAMPSIRVASSGSPSAFGKLVTFTATVTGNDTNPVTFYSGGTPLGTATPSNGTATLTTTSLPVGTNSITASIAAGGNYTAAAFSGLTQTINGNGQPDTGTVALQVNGSIIAQATYGEQSTPTTIAATLASTASSSLVNVSAVGDSLYIESTASGAGNAYPYSIAVADTAGFNAPAFSVSPASGTLEGAGAGGSGSGQTLYSYCVSGSSNNCTAQNSGYDPAGNLLGYSDSVMGTWSFGYDSLNRLISGVPAAGNNSNGGLSLCWSYDSFGNRTSQNAQSGACPTLPTLPAPTAAYNANNQVTWTTVHGAAAGLVYDAAGNVVNDNLNTYLYDGEGRICAVASTPVTGLTTMTGYLYDADGTRVAKGSITSMSCDPAVNGFQTTSDYVLGPGGEQVTEVSVDANGTLAHQHTNVWAAGKLLATYDDGGLHFYIDDPLGTRRVQTDYAGVIEHQCSGLPYGDGESCTATPTEHLFTGKERDTESGLDYFGARYYASNVGRFMSPDSAAIPDTVPYADFGNPQSLNLYAYAGNNPIRFADPDGHVYYVCPAGVSPCTSRNGTSVDDNSFESEQRQDQANGVTYAHGSITDSTGTLQGTYSYDPDIAGDPAANIAAAGQIARDGNGAINLLLENMAIQVGTAGLGVAVEAGADAIKAARVARAMRAVAAAGRAGESAASAMENLGVKKAIQVGGRTFIPDGLTSTTLNEVKNVANLSYTAQLRAFSQYAGANKLTFQLWVRSTTVLSGPLQDAVSAGKIVLRTF